jgi:outer membrane protein assembly factor BamB
MTLRLDSEKWSLHHMEATCPFRTSVRNVLPLLLSYCLSVCCVIGWERSACAQQQAAENVPVEPADELQRLPSDRKIAQQLQELTREARVGKLERIRDLLHVLQAAEPSLLVPDGNSTFRPLHRDLIERILEFPQELQNDILKDGSVTAQLLTTAFEDDGPGAIVEFLHRHSGTTESYRAHLLLAALHRDRGHRQAMLYWLSPLLNSAAPADLRQIAMAMENDEPDQSVSSAADESATKAVPLSKAWQRELHLSSMQRRESSELVRELAADANHPAIAWMAAEPIVDEQAVYVRSSGGLLAYDRTTGRVMWTRLFDRQTDARRTTDIRRLFPDANNRAPLDTQSLQNSAVIVELHRNEVTTRMTSDDSRLFVICDTGESTASLFENSEPFRRFQRRGDQVFSSLRELVAIEKSTGRRLWSIGGAPLEAQFGNELAQAWFAGPPTVHGGALCGLIEQDDAHWLVCLRCETGEVLWKLILAYPDTNIFQDSSRQLTASRPLIAEGLIWTNTTDGWLIAVDGLTRSVLWSRNMIQNQPGMSRPRNLRGGFLQIQTPKSFRECWRPEAMQLTSDSLLVAGPEGHQMLMINPLTGSVRRRTTPETATVILLVDDESIVVAGPRRIQRLRRDNFEVVWATTLTTPDVVPTGPGARRDDHLLVPLSDGSIQVVRYSDGQMTDTIRGLRPEFSAGGLTEIADDIVSYGPDHVALLTRSGATVPHEPDLMEQARSLIAAGRFGDAEKTLAGFTPSPEQSDATHRLLFRIATALALDEPAHREIHLQNAARYALTSQDKAVVQFLTFQTQPEITPGQIAETLNAAPAVLLCELPEWEELKLLLVSPFPDNPIDVARSETARATGNSSIRRPLRHFLLQAFEQNLAESESATSATGIADLKQLSDADLLSISLCIARVRDELLRRAEDAILTKRLTESTLHLLLQAKHCEDQIGVTESAQSAPHETDSPFEERFAGLVDRFRNGLIADAARADLPLRPHPATLNLLAVVQAEVLPASARSEFREPQQVLAEQWNAWKERSYSIVPVNPVAAMTSSTSNEQRLMPRCRDDQFVSAWSWSIFREPSVLAGRSLLQPTEPLCTIDGGMFDSLGSGSDGTVIRAGSVLLVQNSAGLTAVSLIDQRVLWSRRIPNQPSGTMWPMMPDMHLFERFSTKLPAWQEVYGRHQRICGGNDRWICVQSPTQVEMIDLLTGQNLWSLEIPPGRHDIFATESCVFLSDQSERSDLNDHPSETVKCLNRIDGTVRQTAYSHAQLQQTILATGDELVMCESLHSDPGATTLHWMDAVTGEVRHSLPLANSLNCQFMDARTLVSVTSKAVFEIIDLLTAEKQTVPFAADVNYDATAEKGTTPDFLRKVAIAADPINYYVFPISDRRGDRAQIMLNSMGDLHLYPVAKEVRAIDRSTGKLRWVWDVDGNTAVWFEPTADPVLLLINSTVRQNKANLPRGLAIPGLVMRDDFRATVTALSRVSGTKLFDYTTSLRFPVPRLEFKITPQQHLDLRAFGNRVRFVPEQGPVAAP